MYVISCFYFLLCSIVYRLVHSFTCAGVLQTQYIKLSSFAGLGTVKNSYIRQGTCIYTSLTCVSLVSVDVFIFCTVYKKGGYIDIVACAAEQSMKTAIEEVQSLPHYQEKGEVSLSA